MLVGEIELCGKSGGRSRCRRKQDTPTRERSPSLMRTDSERFAVSPVQTNASPPVLPFRTKES